MQVRRIEGFKTQWRWLTQHPEVVIWLGFETVYAQRFHGVIKLFIRIQNHCLWQ
jgi:hypothetical protein